jgi:hypothetical protein
MPSSKKKSREQIYHKQEKEQNLKLAIEAFHIEQSRPAGEQRLTLNQIVNKYNVNYHTLKNRLDGKQTMEEFNSQKSLLSKAEDLVMIQNCINMAELGFPLTLERVEELVNMLLLMKHAKVEEALDITDPTTLFMASQKEIKSTPKVGKLWARNWLNRHNEKNIQEPYVRSRFDYVQDSTRIV